MIDSVVRQRMSGQEASVFVVRSGVDTLLAKIYQKAILRTLCVC